MRNLLERAQAALLEGLVSAACRLTRPEPNPEPVIVGRHYLHHKGGVYTVVGLARHSENDERLVVYVGKDGVAWARPYDMFADGRFVILDPDYEA